MNRQRFESLPEAAKAVIRRYSGENAAAPWIEFYGGTERRSLDRIKSDPAGKAVEPSPADIEATHRVYQALLQNYAAKSAQNRRLVDLIEAELSIIRSDNR
jgi:TRAP-type mannitol/chloroaromatic compound transport system substrate-binding protein